MEASRLACLFRRGHGSSVSHRVCQGRKPSLQRQSQRLQETLANAGIQNRVVAVPGESHELIVLTLSRPDKISAPAILDFIHTARCP